MSSMKGVVANRRVPRPPSITGCLSSPPRAVKTWSTTPLLVFAEHPAILKIILIDNYS